LQLLLKHTFNSLQLFAAQQKHQQQTTERMTNQRGLGGSGGGGGRRRRNCILRSKLGLPSLHAFFNIL